MWFTKNGGKFKRVASGAGSGPDVASCGGDGPGGVDQLGPFALRSEHLFEHLLWPVCPLGRNLLHPPDSGPALLCHKVTQARKMVRVTLNIFAELLSL